MIRFTSALDAEYLLSLDVADVHSLEQEERVAYREYEQIGEQWSNGALIREYGIERAHRMLGDARRRWSDAHWAVCRVREN